MSLIVLFVFVFLAYYGYDYYSTPLEERFYHARHDWFKPSGILGHGLGIIGTLLILFGVLLYIACKRYGFLSRVARLKYWLEFHIFLCSLGPVMVLFHTAFKFGGIVSIAFWSMVAVVASGVIGRFIYIQIPRTIEGRELSLQEVQHLKQDMEVVLKKDYQLADEQIETVLNLTEKKQKTEKKGLINGLVRTYFEDRKAVQSVTHQLKTSGMSRPQVRQISKMVSNELSLNNRIERLQTMQKLFKYWHVVHMPFALIMLVIVLLHIGITLAFGYKWIF